MADGSAATDRQPSAGPSSDAAADGFTPVEAPSISLPKGGGAIRGIGEKFAANPALGTGSLSLPIPTSPGRNGFGPQLALAYDSGAGNGPFGFGWNLRLPSITRKTDKGLPEYRDAEESDVFVLGGTEDLVPTLRDDGSRFEDRVSHPGYVIHRYRPRVEALFTRIERWTRESDGAVHWRSYSRDNILTLYGKDGNARIADPQDPQRVFSWLICETRDDRGNGVVYEYVHEDGARVDLVQAHERNRGGRNDPRRTANRYLKRIQYGNRTPLLDAGGRRPTFLTGGQLAAAGWMFEVVFDYDEGHYEQVELDPNTPSAEQHRRVRATTTAARAWMVRPDPFSSYRSGFEVRTYRRCHRVLVFHHLPALGGGEKGYEGLVRVTEFDYADADYGIPLTVDDEHAHPGSTRFASFIASVTQSGYTRDEAAPIVEHDGAQYTTYLQASIPPLELHYSKAAIQDEVLELDADSLENLPAGLDTLHQWVDLDGEGLSGILTEQDGAWFYKRNLGGGSFGPLETVAPKPAPRFAGGRQQLLDLEGDGRLALVSFAGPAPGYYERTDESGWESFVAFRELPNAAWEDPNLRFVDLDGDGHAEVLVTEQEVLTWHPSLAEEGFAPARRVHQAPDEEQGPRLVFADGTQSIYLADMSGDGLTDLVRVRNGDVCYWPSLGYGAFGAKVALDNAPWFDGSDEFDERRIRLADIDGSGATDVLYLGRDAVRLYFNQSGNRLSDARALPPLPHADEIASVTATDLLGNGTACLVWSSPLPADARRPLRYIDLMGGTKPHLLIGSRNNLGAETRVEYAPSTRFYLADKQAGRPWVTRLPFPVHVVERVVTLDHISGNRFVTRYAYHHGHYDGFEREFRGFGLVEQWDTEEFAALAAGGAAPAGTNVEASSHVPPVRTKTWFHTGLYIGRDHVSDYFAGLLDADDVSEYYSEPASTLLPDTVLPDGLSGAEEREACRALKGSMLRQEVYADDGTARAADPYVVTEQNFSVRMLQPQRDNRHAVFLSASRETLTYHYERDPTDPRVGHTFALEVDDYGNIVRSAAVAYGRRVPDPDLLPIDQAKQAQIHIVLTTHVTTNAVDAAGDYRTPVRCDSRSHELTGLTLAAGTTRFGFVQIAQAGLTATEIAYEQQPTSGALEKRLFEHVRTYFRRDDLSGIAPLGVLESLGIPYESYKLALTPGLVTQVYGARVTAAMLANEARYVHTEGDSAWWIPSGRTFLSPDPAHTAAQELAYARQHFFLPRRYRDPFHTAAVSTESVVTYDDYDLYPCERRDALGNETAVDRYDYRVLQPALVVDANGNRSEVAFDALGFVVAQAAMGKAPPAPVEGDSLTGLDPDLTQAEVDAFFADPQGPVAATLLGQASTRLVYDPNQHLIAAAPTAVGSIRRRTHVSELGPGEQSGLLVSIAYADGFGREIQSKVHSRAGPVPERDATGNVILGPNGEPVLTAGDVDSRWVASGWTVFNNKGKPVRQYEPFFTDRHQFEFDVRVGVSPIVFYDPVGRTVGTLHADHSWEKVLVGPWRQESWDVNDTILLDPAADPVLGGYFQRLPAADYLPTWNALRTDPVNAAAAALRWPDADTRAAERRAAEGTAVHAATPSASHADSLARPVVTIVHNRFKYSNTPPAAPPIEERYSSRVDVDIRGNQRAVHDAAGRRVTQDDFDLVGRGIHHASMEAGERRSLADVSGQTVYAWDSRDQRFRTTHDALRRPTGTFLRKGAGAEVLVAQTTYGESRPNPEANNLRTRVVEVRDQAGTVTTDSYDFEGNLLRTERRLATDYAATLDWSQPVAEEDELFTSLTRYDALGRAIQLVAPHSDTPGATFNVIQPVYDEGNLLEQLHVWNNRANEPATLLDPATATMHSVADVHYDAQGRRLRVDFGNGVRTSYDYDSLSRRLVGVTSRRDDAAFPDDCPQPPPAGWPGCRIQSLHYVYDPAGNVTSSRDTAQQTIFFRNRRVTPDCEFTYDAAYRLIEGTGREHLGQVGGAPILHSYNDVPRIRGLHPGDGNAMGRYVERYSYDAVGNLLSMQHRGSDPANPGWSRDYTYAETSQLEPAKKSNRLTRTSIGGIDDVYSTGGDGYDAHGNLLRMPQVQEMQWDFRDQLRMTRRQAVNAGDADGTTHAGERTWYVYNADGHRIRKVTEGANGAVRNERVYLGGFEIYRRNGNDPLIRETLHVMDNTQRVALVETRTAGAEPGVPAELVRYQLGNHLGSVSIELDERARLVTYEEYTPFGSSSYQAVRNALETPKRYRFTGTERDEESGLNYNGARYYASWLGRWTSTDPLGIQGGTSLYVYCRDNPVSRTDTGGRQDESSTAVGLTVNSGGVTLGPFMVTTPDPNRGNFVVAFGRADRPYMDIAQSNTGLTAINIQDSINLRRGVGFHFPSSWQLETDYSTTTRGSGGLYPMFSGHMAQEALEGNAAGTVHFDARGADLTPPLRAGTSPGFSPDDFHSSSELRQGVATLASTGPGERKVTIVIQHEEGISTITPGSNTVQGAALPARLADRMPNIDNNPNGGPGTGGANGGSSSSGTSSNASTGSRAPSTGASSTGSRGGSGGGGRTGGGGGRAVTAPSAASATLGTVGRVVPGVVEGEAALMGAAYLAAGHTATAGLVAPLMTAAEAMPVAAGVGVVGAGAGHAARALASAAGASEDTANGVGFVAAVATGAALGSVIPGVGTAVGAGIGAAVAGGLYLWSIW